MEGKNKTLMLCVKLIPFYIMPFMYFLFLQNENLDQRALKELYFFSVQSVICTPLYI